MCVVSPRPLLHWNYDASVVDYSDNITHNGRRTIDTVDPLCQIMDKSSGMHWNQWFVRRIPLSNCKSETFSHCRSIAPPIDRVGRCVEPSVYNAWSYNASTVPSTSWPHRWIDQSMTAFVPAMEREHEDQTPPRSGVASHWENEWLRVPSTVLSQVSRWGNEALYSWNLFRRSSVGPVSKIQVESRVHNIKIFIRGRGYSPAAACPTLRCALHYVALGVRISGLYP